jgi:hypothetical protein
MSNDVDVKLRVHIPGQKDVDCHDKGNGGSHHSVI